MIDRLLDLLSRPLPFAVLAEFAGDPLFAIPRRERLTPSMELAMKEVVAFLMQHPYCVFYTSESQTSKNLVYTDAFRRFIVGLTGPGRPGRGMSAAELARVSGMPLDLVEEWLRSP